MGVSVTKLQTLRPKPVMQVERLSRVNPESWHGAELSARQRGYDSRWEKARAGYLKKHPLCRYCEQDSRLTPATVVDHIVPHRGDRSLFWESSNWQPLCAPCHNGRKQREERQSNAPRL